jgi:hypothetical protein
MGAKELVVRAPSRRINNGDAAKFAHGIGRWAKKLCEWP